jgi:cytochrome c oxidase subunit II
MSLNLALFGRIDESLPQASDMAARVDSIITGLLVSATAVCLILAALTIHILIRYRRGSTAARKPIAVSTWKIETAWTVGTLAVFLYFFFRGAAVYIDMERTPPETGAVHIVARQWMWDMRYDDGRREFNVLHLRQNSPVRLLISSEDVIHSFFVPAFRLKQDAVPGKIVSAWVNPTRLGTYRLYCAQYCGTAHAEMGGIVIVLAPAEYDAWKNGGDASTTRPLARGKAAYAKYGCGRCHEDRSAIAAPSLAGLFGNRVILENGRTVLADEQYLHDSILASPEYVVAVYPHRMPSYAGIIGESETADLILYIRSLGASNAVASIP